MVCLCEDCNGYPRMIVHSNETINDEYPEMKGLQMLANIYDNQKQYDKDKKQHQ